MPDITVGSGEPQVRQKDRAPLGDEANVPTLSSPASQRKPSAGATAQVTNTEPCSLRHIEQ
jgi:hypothetical protein